jgi:hypothetical protein
MSHASGHVFMKNGKFPSILKYAFKFQREGALHHGGGKGFYSGSTFTHKLYGDSESMR